MLAPCSIFNCRSNLYHSYGRWNMVKCGLIVISISWISLPTVDTLPRPQSGDQCQCLTVLDEWSVVGHSCPADIRKTDCDRLQDYKLSSCQRPFLSAHKHLHGSQLWCLTGLRTNCKSHWDWYSMVRAFNLIMVNSCGSTWCRCP